MFRDRKSQQQTLSIRISESVRTFLDRARKQFSETRGESMSISDVAKLLLESAIESRLDDRLETTDLLEQPTEALLRIRHKWVSNLPLTRAEWTVLAQYAQSGCEELSSDPELPSRESFADVLEAFLAVRSLRLAGAPEMDRYYLGNLSGWTDESDKSPRGAVQPHPEVVPAVVRRIMQDLRESPGSARPSFAARNLYVALRDERLEGADSLNRALVPFLPCLYHLAARGHWFIEHRPLREERKPWETLESVPPRVPDLKLGDFALSGVLGQEGELHMLLRLNSHRIAYSLGPYPHIREFQAMVEKLVPGRTWNGRYFFAHTDDLVPPRDRKDAATSTFYFREHSKGVLVEFTAAEWRELKSLFAQVVELPELKPTLAELALQYGEV